MPHGIYIYDYIIYCMNCRLWYISMYTTIKLAIVSHEDIRLANKHGIEVGVSLVDCTSKDPI